MAIIKMTRGDKVISCDEKFKERYQELGYKVLGEDEKKKQKVQENKFD